MVELICSFNSHLYYLITVSSPLIYIRRVATIQWLLKKVTSSKVNANLIIAKDYISITLTVQGIIFLQSGRFSGADNGQSEQTRSRLINLLNKLIFSGHNGAEMILLSDQVVNKYMPKLMVITYQQIKLIFSKQCANFMSK